MKCIPIICAVVIGLSWDAYACKCSGESTVKGSFEGATTVVHGKVLSMKLISFAETMESHKADEVRAKLKDDQWKHQFFDTDFVFEVMIEVIENFKGNIVHDTVTIYTTMNSASCGYRFELNKNYVIYAYKESTQSRILFSGTDGKHFFGKENTYWTNHCTRTKNYDQTEVNALRKLQK